eukprot:9475921-Pyramimonas_sp.AAC.1
MGGSAHWLCASELSENKGDNDDRGDGHDCEAIDAAASIIDDTTYDNDDTHMEEQKGGES